MTFQGRCDAYQNVLLTFRGWLYDLCVTKAAYITADAASFAKIIRRLRMAEGWTIAELARRSGFNKNHLSLIELGKNIPSLNMLFELAEIFRVEAAEMVREAELARRERKTARAAAMLAADELKRAGEPEPPVE